MDRPIGERVAGLETRMERTEDDVVELRNARHNHANRLAALVDAPRDIRELQELPPRVERLEEDVHVMAKSLLPEQNRTIGVMADEMRSIREKVMTRSTDVGWVMRIVGFATRDLLTPILLAVIIYFLLGKS